MVLWIALLLLLTTQPTLFPRQTEAVGPPAPSGRPAVGGGGDELVAIAESGSSTLSADAWLKGRRVDSAAVALRGGPDEITAAVQLGAEADLEVDQQFEVLSVSKTMVSAAALQLVDAGVLSLDEPLPWISGLPASLTQNETLRRLLAHASGLIDYRVASGYRTDAIMDPRQAVLIALEDSDLSVTKVNYSATNYFVVGLLIEQVTDQSLAQVLTERFFEPLGLEHTEMIDNTRAGFVGFASGGVVSTLEDIATWYDALVRRQVVLPPAMLDEMIWGGAEYQTGGGLGAWRHCPCTAATADDPMPWLYVFHDGGDVRVAYVPSQDVVMAMRFSTPLYGRTRIVDGIDDFMFAVLADHWTAPSPPDPANAVMTWAPLRLV